MSESQNSMSTNDNYIYFRRRYEVKTEMRMK